jgi:hypothetical protein
MEKAIGSIYPVLKNQNRLDEVFHYQSLTDFAAQLEQEKQPTR